MTITEAIGQYVRDKGVDISELAKNTGYSYKDLVDSLGGVNNTNRRDLKADELIAICRQLNLDPLKLRN